MFVLDSAMVPLWHVRALSSQQLGTPLFRLGVATARIVLGGPGLFSGLCVSRVDFSGVAYLNIVHYGGDACCKLLSYSELTN